MDGLAYKLPLRPLAPGEEPAPDHPFADITSMPPRAIIASPADGARFPAGLDRIRLRGAAWGGDVPVSQVEITCDGGRTWRRASLTRPRNRYDWRRFDLEIGGLVDGWREFAARAVGRDGVGQPMWPHGWNPQGYAVNPVRPIAIRIG